MYAFMRRFVVMLVLKYYTFVKKTYIQLTLSKKIKACPHSLYGEDEHVIDSFSVVSQSVICKLSTLLIKILQILE